MRNYWTSLCHFLVWGAQIGLVFYVENVGLLALLLGGSKHGDLNGEEHKSKDVKSLLQTETMKRQKKRAIGSAFHEECL